MPIDITNNPIGNANLDLVKEIIEKMKAQWAEILQQAGKTPGRIKDYWVKAVYYLMVATDVLVNFVEDAIPAGADKKATVLLAISALYDNIVVPQMPLWLKPFSGKIKQFIIGVMLSMFIDWLVGKYNKGSWSPTPTPTPTEPTPDTSTTTPDTTT